MMPFNLPIFLTYSRIFMIPVFVAVFYLPHSAMPQMWINQAAAILFTLASVTDWLDGYLARAWNQTSAFGAFLDPVADKLMVAAALIVLVKLGRVDDLIALIIIGREIAISALREWMAEIGQRKSVAVSYVGKLKTAAQMVAIILLLYSGPVFHLFNAQVLGTWLIYIAAFLTLWSMAYYLRMAMPDLLRTPQR
jgi:CDP-diacylglycerol--glycerol-3-phosphate 3-phosphatidyltransferase